jgi:hypothetical protein
VSKSKLSEKETLELDEVVKKGIAEKYVKTEERNP